MDLQGSHMFVATFARKGGSIMVNQATFALLAQFGARALRKYVQLQYNTIVYIYTVYIYIYVYIQ